MHGTCLIEGQNVNEKYMYISGDGKLIVRTSNITLTGCSVVPNPGHTIEVYAETPSTVWTNGCI